MSISYEAITPFATDPPLLLSDANYNEHVVRGLRRVRSDFSIITAHQVGIDRLSDPDVLAYAARHDLILLTHDTRTMPGHFITFLAQLKPGEHCPGVWYTAQNLAAGVAIRAIIEAWLCSAHDEYRNQELRLPV